MRKTVQVVDRHPRDRHAPYLRIRPVTVEWQCPVCGGPRGNVRQHLFYEDGESYICDIWSNPCGHVDLHDAVIREAEQMLQSESSVAAAAR